MTVTADDIKRVDVPVFTFAKIEAHANNACLGFASSVRTSDADRKGRLLEDQITGLCGEWAFSKHYGLEEEFFKRREEIDKNPLVGDGGTDVGDWRVDIKTSLIRSGHKPVLDFHLLVRPREYDADTMYVLALLSLSALEATVHLIGWSLGADLVVQEDGFFRTPGRVHILPGRQLAPLPSRVEAFMTSGGAR